MSRSVVLIGPLSPMDVADLLAEPDRTVARDLRGYRGIPTSDLARAFTALGIDVEVVTEAPEIEDTLELRGPRLRVLIAPLRQRARDRALDLFRQERRALSALLRETEGSIIHAQWTYEFAWAALDSGRPVVVTAHDAPLTILRHFRDAYRALRALMAYVVRSRTSNLTAVSPYLAERWRREMGYRRPITVIPNMVGSSFFQVARVCDARPSVLDVTDASPRKNTHALITAFHLLRGSGSDLTLDLVGAGLGPDDPVAQSSLMAGTGEGVRFLGPLDRNEVMHALGRATVFAHASLEESFGISVAEAMAAGVPVVGGKNSGGVPWVVGGSDAGLLVDVTRPREIASAIELLVTDPDLADTLGAHARQRAQEMFGVRAVAAAYVDEYERLLGGAW